jgi:hypothetical protein
MLPTGFEPLNPSKQTTTELRLRPRGQWARLTNDYTCNIFTINMLRICVFVKVPMDVTSKKER